MFTVPLPLLREREKEGEGLPLIIHPLPLLKPPVPLNTDSIAGSFQAIYLYAIKQTEPRSHAK